jgi:hypothetical protein
MTQEQRIPLGDGYLAVAKERVKAGEFLTGKLHPMRGGEGAIAQSTHQNERRRILRLNTADEKHTARKVNLKHINSKNDQA